MALTAETARLAEALLDTGCIKHGSPITLTSGVLSDIYVDLRDLRSLPEVRDLVMEEYMRMLDEIKQTHSFHHLVDSPDAVSNLVGALVDRRKSSQLTVRKRLPGHGTNKMVLGRYQPGETAVVIDDILTKGGSIASCHSWLTEREAHLSVNHAVVLVDRQEGGRQYLESLGLQVVSSLTLNDLRIK